MTKALTDVTLTLRRRPNGVEPDVPPTDGTPDDGTPDAVPDVPRELADLIRPDGSSGG